MEPADILSTIVELSVAIAGFSGVVAALAPARPSLWPTAARLLFATLLLSTAVSASVALLAMVVLATPLPAAVAWSTVSGAHGAILAAVVTYRSLQGFRAGMRATGIFLPIALVMPAVVVLQFANALFYHVAWLCLVALAVYAVSGFAFFIMLVRLLWNSSIAGQSGIEKDSK